MYNIAPNNSLCFENIAVKGFSFFHGRHKNHYNIGAIYIAIYM